MSLEKAILHGKEKRKPYHKHDPRSVDWSCRNHGSCKYCYENRKGHHLKAEQEITRAMMEETENENADR